MNEISKWFIGILLILPLFYGCGGSDSSSATVYTVGGSLSVGSQLRIDWDTNDPNNGYKNNDGETLQEVQPAANPSTIGGYLGALSAMPVQTDVSDVYAVDLLKGQEITLFVSDPDNIDFDLYLYDESGKELDNSEGVGNYEVIGVPEDGKYFVQVYGYSIVEEGGDGGVYNLIIGQKNNISTTDYYRKTHLSSLAPMVRSEVLMKLKATARTAPFGAQEVIGKAGLAPAHISRSANGVVRFALKNAVHSKNRIHQRKLFFDPVVNETVKAVKKLRHLNEVEWAEPNYIAQAFQVPNDIYYNLQWHYPLINLPEAWDVTTGSSDVIVAVVDTGVVLKHPDLAGQLVQGYDFISDADSSNDGDGIDNNPDDPGDANSTEQSSFHGTHVAGTIAAVTNNNFGVAGIAWQSKIMPVRVLGKGGAGSFYDIAQGVLYAAGLPNDSRTLPSKKADIISMSLGAETSSQFMTDAINDARNAGVLIVAAAGNENRDATNYTPAGLDGVITVSAVDYNGKRTSYSNYGDVVEVAAPGGDTTQDANGDGYPDGVLSTVLDTYKFYQGTSMAAPHVSGVIALMKSVYPQLTYEDMIALFAGKRNGTSISIVTDRGTPGKDPLYGYGLINALGAVNAAQELAQKPVSPTPVISAIPQSLTFNTSRKSIILHLTNIGGGVLEVTKIQPSETWLRVSPSTGDNQYKVEVDFSKLDNGAHTAVLDITSNGGNLEIPVFASKSDTQETLGEVGTVYVLLADPVTYKTVDQVVTSADEGYRFSFTNVAAGDYLLVAGTDINNDAFIDNDGEAKGAYPTESQPQKMSISGNRENVNITLSYQTALPSAASVSTQNNRPFIRYKRLQ